MEIGYFKIPSESMLAAGTHLGPYEILAPLGAGGMGEVYRAQDPRLGRQVAIKILPPERAFDPQRLQRSRTRRAPLRRSTILTSWRFSTSAPTQGCPTS